MNYLKTRDILIQNRSLPQFQALVNENPLMHFQEMSPPLLILRMDAISTHGALFF